MGLFGKKSFHVGDEFGSHANRKYALKKAIVGYARLMKSSYTPRQDKRTIKEKMDAMKMELIRLDEEEKYYGMQRTITNKKARIKSLKPKSMMDKILDSGSSGSGKQYMTHVPDMIGSMGGGRRRKSGGLDFRIPKVI